MWQLITISILLAIIFGTERFAAALGLQVNSTSLEATGFIILVCFALGQLFKRFGIPALLAYLVAGIAFGPNLASMIFGSDSGAILSNRVISDLSMINLLTVGVIGTMGGGELKLSELREGGKTILAVVFGAVTVTIIATFAVMMLIPQTPLPMMQFMRAISSAEQGSVALLLALLLAAMSPTITLAVMQDLRAKGKMTSTVLGVSIVADLSVVALFLVALAIAKLTQTPEGLTSAGLIAALPGIGMEFLWALIIGAVAGAVIIGYFRFISREMLFFTVAMIFSVSYVCKIMHAETLLAFLTGGFLVQNLSRHGHAMVHELEKISLPVFIVYFMTQAGQLDLRPLLANLPLTLTLVSLRGLTYGLTIRKMTQWINAPEPQQRLLWMCFYSQGSVDLVLAGMVADAIPAWGKEVQTIVMSVVVVHMTLGPPLLKIALSRAGETEESRERSKKEADDIGALGASTPVGQPGEFALPQFDDRLFNDHLLDLRDQLEALHADLIAEPFAQRRAKIEAPTLEITREATEALARLSELLQAERFQSEEARVKAIRALHAHYRRRLKAALRQLQACERPTFSAESAQTLLASLQRMEDFEDEYTVTLEPALEQPQGGRAQRLIRAWRRARRRIVGPGKRTIPVGQLWRFYVELAVPRLMAGAAQGASQAHIGFWRALGRTLRQIDEVFRISMELLVAPPPARVEASPADHDKLHDEHHNEHSAHDEHGAPAPEEVAHLDVRARLDTLDVQDMDGAERARAFLAAVHADALDSLALVREQLTRAISAATYGYSWSLQQAYGEFLDAASRAGTLDLPAFRYRASLQFDRARRAEAQLKASLKQEADTISGLLGWMTIEQQLVPFLSWFEDYQQRVLDALRGNLQESCARQLDRLRQQCKRHADEPASPASWADLYTRELAQTLRLTRRALDRSLVAFGQGVASRRLIDTLEVEVAAFTEEVVLLAHDPDEPAPSADTLRLRARAWFSNRLVNEIGLRFIEFNERTERLLRRTLVGLDDVDQVLEFNLTSAQTALQEGEPENAREVATTALDRASRLVEQLHDALLSDMREIERWIQLELRKLAQDASAPLLQRNLTLIRRDQTRLALDDLRPEHWSRKNLDPVMERARRVWGALAPVYEELVEDVRAILREEPRQEQRAQVRARLHMDRASVADELPPIYKRLFNPVPLDLPDFYVERPELERRVLDAVARWGEGLPTSLLLFGDRGIGKRTFIHNMVPLRIYDIAPVFQEIPIQTIRMGEELESQAELCSQLAPLVAGDAPAQLSELSRRIQSGERRQIVILENANKCYARTREGLALCRDFLRLMNDTSGRVLWIVLMDAPAAVLLDHILDLFDYFTHAFEVAPLTPQELERMILKRHRVSGFGVQFIPGQPRMLERLTHPLATREARFNPQRVFFEGLGQVSHGNALLALLLWIEHIALTPNTASTLTVTPIAPPQQELIEGLTLPKKLILALILQHGSASVALLGRVLDRPLGEITTELEHLQRLGFVEQAVGSAQSWRLRNLAAPQVTAELRRHNLV
jgi:Kef-type K+ transport system membrane component KefB